MIYGEEALVYVYPTELWSYIRENRKLIAENDVLIAENPADGLEIQIRFKAEEPYISVFRDGFLIHEERIVSKEDSVVTLRKVYGEYLVPSVPAEPEEPENNPEEMAEIDDETISELRRIELEGAMRAFLSAALCDAFDTVTEDDVDAILEETLSLISSYGFPVYAPVIIDGEFVEYPFDLEEVATN